MGCLGDLWINKQCVRPLPFLRLLVVHSPREHESGAKKRAAGFFGVCYLIFGGGCFHDGKLQFWQKENAFVKLTIYILPSILAQK